MKLAASCLRLIIIILLGTVCCSASLSWTNAISWCSVQPYPLCRNIGSTPPPPILSSGSHTHHGWGVSECCYFQISATDNTNIRTTEKAEICSPKRMLAPDLEPETVSVRCGSYSSSRYWFWCSSVSFMLQCCISVQYTFTYDYKDLSLCLPVLILCYKLS